jgi:uncharacterized DUF497 family protein
MMDLRFIWDPNKEKINKRKHKISFSEAQTVFLDEYARRIYDPSHSITEDRFLLLGMSSTIRILVVCHCYKENDEVIRIISARKASKKEEAQYNEKRI